jgi:hypothetical protein
MISPGALLSNDWSNPTSTNSAASGGTAFSAPTASAAVAPAAVTTQTQLGSRMQALLLELQSESGTSTGRTATSTANGTRTASLDQAASGARGPHHHHRGAGETQQDGASPNSLPAQTGTASATTAQALQAYASVAGPLGTQAAT